MFLALIIAIPIFIILGIVITVSRRPIWDTFLYFPLFLAGLPMLGIVPFV